MKIDPMCLLTAASDTTSRRAMAALDSPRAMRDSTSRSRGASRFSGLERAASITRTTSRSRTVPPEATLVTASANSSTSPIRSLSR